MSALPNNAAEIAEVKVKIDAVEAEIAEVKPKIETVEAAGADEKKLERLDKKETQLRDEKKQLND
jgi:hypothetical protein